MSNDLPPGWGGPAPSQTGYNTMGQGSLNRPIWIYAGFWWRVWAFLIDAVLLSIVEGVLGFFLLPHMTVEWEETPIPDASGQTMDVVDIASIQPDTVSVLIPHIHTGDWHAASIILACIPALYFILFEASSYRATPGKRLCNLEVLTLQGEQLSLARAALRFAIKAFISFPFVYIGVLMVAFTRHKQALHDLIAGTLVVRAENKQTVTFERRF
ncbi:RDD family protein [Acetobacter orientalis]|uniref:RDD family protein n=1 Tax=Acetobacter orientalis TaxID=146474 RepID=UPI0039E8893F